MGTSGNHHDETADEAVGDAIANIANTIADYRRQDDTEGAHAALMRIAEIIDELTGDE